MNPFRRRIVSAVLVVLLASTTAALAGEPDSLTAPETTESTEADAAPAGPALDADALSEALSATPDPTDAVALPKRASNAPDLDWKQTNNSSGTAYTVKRTVTADWNTNIGADFDVRDTRTNPGDPNWLPPAKNAGAAWANVQVPGVASFDARVGGGDASNSKFGVSRTLPFGGITSLTLQGSASVVEASAETPAGLPGSRAAPVWSTDRQVKLNILPTGTSFGAGTSNSTDGLAHTQLRAEQKLFDKFNVTTTFSDPGAAASSRSIMAGFKTQW